jgi:hypothetical protein
LRAAGANFSSGTKQSSVQRRTAAKRNDAEKTAEKIMAVVLNGLKSLYREQRQEIYNFVTSATNYRGERGGRPFFPLFLFFITCAIPTPPSHDESPRRRQRKATSGQTNWRLIRTFYTFQTRARFVTALTIGPELPQQTKEQAARGS